MLMKKFPYVLEVFAGDPVFVWSPGRVPMVEGQAMFICHDIARGWLIFCSDEKRRWEPSFLNNGGICGSGTIKERYNTVFFLNVGLSTNSVPSLVASTDGARARWPCRAVEGGADN